MAAPQGHLHHSIIVAEHRACEILRAVAID